jgi:hypothetical protein
MTLMLPLELCRGEDKTGYDGARKRRTEYMRVHGMSLPGWI